MDNSVIGSFDEEGVSTIRFNLNSEFNNMGMCRTLYPFDFSIDFLLESISKA
jgi:hypothetical protein